MWIATKHGFYSIVHKENAYHIRARVHRDLENLIATAQISAPIETWPSADYRWRIRITDPEEFARIWQILGKSISYPNFKSEIHRTPDQLNKLAHSSALSRRPTEKCCSPSGTRASRPVAPPICSPLRGCWASRLSAFPLPTSASGKPVGSVRECWTSVSRNSSEPTMLDICSQIPYFRQQSASQA